jgi:two-component system heavy metal sensor histidine kinase CusS
MRLPPGLSLTARLALLFAAMTASLVIVVGVVIGRAVEHHFHELDDHELAGKLTLVGNLLQGADPALPLAERLLRLDDAFAGQDAVAVLLRDDHGRVLHAIQPGFFTAAQLGGDGLPTTSTPWAQDGHQVIGRAARIALPAALLAAADGAGAADAAPAEDAALVALVALDISHHVHFLDELRRGLWLGISGAAFAAAVLGWFAAHRGLAPLRRVTTTARHLSAERLGERLAEDGAPAEVRELVEAFNGMLARLDGSFRRLSDFSADIAHELRTPISNLMTQTQVALSRARSADEYREVLASNMEEYERIARMVADMLFLAQAEDGRLPRAYQTVALADEATALAEFYDALAEAQGVRISVEGAATVHGDRLMLRRALSNLLSNALRHTPAGGEIRIRLQAPDSAGIPGALDEHAAASSAHEAEAEICIENDGDPIPPAQLERIFDRFHRASADRRRHGEGAGLGLAITRSIVHAHGGRIWASSATSPGRAGTTTFTLRLPLDTDASRQAAATHGSNQESAP